MGGSMSQAPAISLQAIVSKRKVAFDNVDLPTLLVCVNQESSGGADGVVEQVRAAYPDVTEILVANLADLRSFPKLLRKVAETIMNSRYNDAAKRIEPPERPEDHIVILPDWDGAAVQALGFTDVSKQIGVALLLPGGTLAGTYQGDDPAKAALDLLASALA